MKCPAQKKVCYKKPDKAWKAAQIMIVKGKSKTTTPNVYRCPHCNYFHWTSRKGEMPPYQKKRLERMQLIRKLFKIT
jgi:hypothetical protein